MVCHGDVDGQMAKISTSEVSYVLSNLKKSAAAMIQDKERSRHSESVWRERLTEKEHRVTELERVVHSEQQKCATMASTMQERTSCQSPTHLIDAILFERSFASASALASTDQTPLACKACAVGSSAMVGK